MGTAVRAYKEYRVGEHIIGEPHMSYRQLPLPLRNLQRPVPIIPPKKDKSQRKIGIRQQYEHLGRAWYYIAGMCVLGAWAKGWKIKDIKILLRDEDVLLVLRAHKGTEKLIAFSGGADLKQSILNLSTAIRTKSLNWKVDEGWESRKKKNGR